MPATPRSETIGERGRPAAALGERRRGRRARPERRPRPPRAGRCGATRRRSSGPGSAARPRARARQALGDAREHAGAVVDLEMEVERRAAARRSAAARARARPASLWRNPVPAVPTIETMSATTEEAVSIPPAPGPSSVISRIASPWSITALKAPVTAASGWRSSTSEGRTRTSSRPSTSVAEPIRRGVSANRRAAPTCALVIPSMPSWSTSSKTTREPKATVARIAILAAASAPVTSSVGSASA